MQLHSAIYSSVLTTLVRFAFANFDVYTDHYRDWSASAPPKLGFRVFGRTPDDACKYVNDKSTVFWPARADASGDKFGIRCEGAGCQYESANPSAITAFEMHFANTPAYHWTLYADNHGFKPPKSFPNGFWMLTAELNTRAPGYCFPYLGDQYDCESMQPAGPSGTEFVVGSRGRRLFRCVTYNGDVKSDDINGLKLQDVDMYYPYPDDKMKSASEGGVQLDESQGMIGQ
ncbi:hypothetical protein DPSP01_004491 [Paraphaeosphaeria sporulosa]